jgi:ubiquinone/menaquinone biosynthesis C-methylase UbiE
MLGNSDLLRAYNDKLASVYDEATTKTDSSWTSPDEVSELVLPHVPPGIQALDIGIGTGQSAEALEEAGAQITGVDISGEMLRKVRDKHPTWKLYECNISTGFPLFNHSFDIVVASGVLEFVPNLKDVFASVGSVLNSNGIFCFTYEESLPEHPLQKEKVAELGKGLEDPVSKELSFLVHRRIPGEIDELLEKTGFLKKTSHQFTAYYRAEGKYPVLYQVVLAQKI